MLFMLFSAFPSFGFLGIILENFIRVLRMTDTDKEFEQIINSNEEVEDNDFDPELINVAIIEGKAYWIYNNTFYEADIVDDVIDKESSKPVDTMNMPIYELNKMLFIVDHLNEG